MSEEPVVNEIKWSIHETNPEMVQTFRDCLSEVIDPEIGMNIIQLGLIRDVVIEENLSRVKMILRISMFSSRVGTGE